MDIQFESEFIVTEKERDAYVEAVKKHIAEEGKDPSLLDSIRLTLADGDPDSCTVSYRLVGKPFERIRRITGSKE